MKIKYILLLIIVPVLFIKPLNAELSINNFFSQSEKRLLLNNEIITKVVLKNRKPVHTLNSDKNLYLPESKYIDKNISGYEMICIEKAFFPCRISKAVNQLFYNQLNNVSGLTKIMYYSRTDEKIQQLITESHGIINTGEIGSSDNYHKKAMQPASEQYFSITDNRFGNLKFKSEVYKDGNSYILKNICIQAMEKLLATINEKGEYQLISFFIYDKKARGYFYYSINAMRIRSSMILSLGMLKPESFGNRIRAYTVYFAGLLGLGWKDRLKAFE